MDRRGLLLAATAAGLAAGAVAAVAGSDTVAGWLWTATVALVLVPTGYDAVRALARGRTGVDLIALAAMAGALAVGEQLAGAVVAVMLTGGQALEARAGARARRELSSLLQRAPRVAHRIERDELVTVDVAEVGRGDELLVRPGEVVPVDGLVTSQAAVLDESALSGESRPVEHVEGERVESGAVCAGSPFRMRAVADAAGSTYAGIVRLVEEAEASHAPFVRLADRYASVFLPLAFGTAGIAWAVSGDAVRGLAVLVVATPCPLLLAAPIAILSGVSRAARRGVIVKGGAALEALAEARAVVLDKTGTLTAGRPRLSRVTAYGDVDADELLRLAASLDQTSAHPYAPALTTAARERGLATVFPSDVAESPGSGIAGVVDGRRVALGGRGWVTRGAPLPDEAAAVARHAAVDGSAVVHVAVDGRPVGALLLDDPPRGDAARTVRALRATGIETIVMVSGDVADIAGVVGEAVGVDRVLAERTPADKVDDVRALQQRLPTIVVGDGVNDAPALAVASVGVAMGARGASASSEAADVVIVVDRLERVVEARRIALRSRHIAVQSVVVGMGLSVVAMGAAAFGLLAPVAGALVQEAIDVAVILNALRALRGPSAAGPRSAAAAEAGARYRTEHRALLRGVETVRSTADTLDRLDIAEAGAALAAVRDFVVDDLLPHEAEEEARLFPTLATLLGDEDPTGSLRREHAEIRRLGRHLAALVEAADGRPTPEDRRDAMRLLYGLHAILRLHFASEEEAYAMLEERHAARGRERAATDPEVRT